MEHLSNYESGIGAHSDASATALRVVRDEILSRTRFVSQPTDPCEEVAEDPDVERRSGDVKGLSDLARAVISARDTGELISAFADTLHSMVPFCTCAITLVDSISGFNTVRHA